MKHMINNIINDIKKKITDIPYQSWFAVLLSAENWQQ